MLCVCVCVSFWVCTQVFVCLSVWENDRVGFCLLFESIFILSCTSSNKSGGNSTRPHGPLKICPKLVLSTCHVDNDSVSSAVWVPALDAVSIFLWDCMFDFFGCPAYAHVEPTRWNLQWYIFLIFVFLSHFKTKEIESVYLHQQTFRHFV